VTFLGENSNTNATVVEAAATLQDQLKVSILHKTYDKLKIKYAGFSFDLVFVCLDFPSSPHGPLKDDPFEPDISYHVESLGRLIESQNPNREVSDSDRPKSVKSSTYFVLEKLTECPWKRDVIRIAKFWSLLMLRDVPIKSQATALELIALHVCARFDEPPKFEEAFKEFLKTLVSYEDLRVIFTENFEALLPQEFMLQLDHIERPFILDPGNPFNALTPTNEALESWAQYAELTLKRYDDHEVCM
jgi:hypothetical protein